LIVRVTTPMPGTVRLTVAGATGVPEAGELSTISGQRPGTTLSVPTIETSVGDRAFALYRAPDTFVRAGSDDDAEPRRTLTVTAEFTAAGGGAPLSTGPVELYVERPPVLLVHGLWGSASGWDELRLRMDPTFAVRTVDYSEVADRSFEVAAAKVLPEVLMEISNYKAPGSGREYRIACVQADVVAHSMGGVVVRTASLQRKFRGGATFGDGPVHKLITIGTPHGGSPFATLANENANVDCCLRTAFGRCAPFFRRTLSEVFAMQGNRIDAGAIDDLVPGSAASLRLASGPPTATHYIVGQSSDEQIRSNEASFLGVLRRRCPLTTLPASFSDKRLFGDEEHDLIVGAASQAGGTAVGPPTSPEISVAENVVHTTVANVLVGPPETASREISDRVVALLNAPLDRATFPERP
jgi:pimeloyl-ACP methyl ester carboxylesterase